MNREMRRHGEEIGLPDWMYESEYDMFSKGLLDEEYGQMQYQALKDEFMLEERPEEDYGIITWFAASFVYPAMEDAFKKAAVSFLWNDPMARERELFQELVIPFNMGKGVNYMFNAVILSMMLVCARQGSRYSAQIIINLYKTFYKEEYNVFKRIHTLDTKVYVEAFGREDMNIDEHNILTARLIVMSELMNKEIDSSWNYVYGALNEEVFRSRLIWRVAEAAYQNTEIQNRRAKQYADNTEWIADHFPEMTVADVQGEDEEYNILKDIWSVVENAVEKQGATDVILSREGEFDIFAYASEVADICREYMDEGEEDADKVILFAFVYFLAESFGKLYVEREKELLSVLGVCRREIVGDDYLEEEGIPKEEVERLRLNGNEADPRMGKLMRMMEALQIPERVKQTTQAADVRETAEGSNHAGEGQDEKKETERLRKLLAEKELQLRETERKAQVQRELYEESKTREKTLEKMIAKQKGEHTELIALREFVYKLEQEEDEPDKDDSKTSELNRITDILKGKTCAIIGGQDGWINKMRLRLPGWIFISVNNSLNLDRVLGNAEAVFLFTDTLSHKMYYRMMNTIRDRKIPFYYIHGVNAEKVIMSMYQNLNEEKMHICQ